MLSRVAGRALASVGLGLWKTCGSVLARVVEASVSIESAHIVMSLAAVQCQGHSQTVHLELKRVKSENEL